MATKEYLAKKSDISVMALISLFIFAFCLQTLKGKNTKQTNEKYLKEKLKKKVLKKRKSKSKFRNLRYIYGEKKMNNVLFS